MEKFNFLLNLFLRFRIYYSRNWECFDQSSVNRPETVHGTLRFLYLSHLLYGICVKIFLMNRYISKSYTTSKNAIDRQYTERGAAVVSTITSLSLVSEDAIIVAATCICSVWRIAQNSWDMSPWNKHHYFRFYKLGVGKVINWLNLSCTPLTTVPCNILRYFVLITKLVLRRFLVFL